MPKITTPTGHVLDAEYGMAPSLTKYAQSKGLNNARIFYVEKSNVYLLAIGETPEYESRSAEDIGCYIDFMVVAKTKYGARI